jgi:hypothetical protein
MTVGKCVRLWRCRRLWRTDDFMRRRMVTRRRIIAEEIAWRNTHLGRNTRVTAETHDEHQQPQQEAASTLLAADIAGIYRDLRKGLEDAKNEPEAADFYYGEMEMRRLAGRGRGDGSPRSPAEPSVVERVLLYGYWGVSGYGLRAWRAATILTVLVVGAALLFSYLGLAVQTPPERIASINPVNGTVVYDHPKPEAPGFWSALNFSAREAISLLQAHNTSVNTQGAGTLTDFVLRLAGPVLLAFIVLALRGRTKR